MAAVNDPRFDICLPFILKEEGGNDDDPNDHGGRTSRGITQREYTAWLAKRGLPDHDVWQASQGEIETIYHDEYWSLRAPKLHPGVDLVWFNFAVNTGPGEANKLLMRSIGPDNEDNDDQTVNRICNGGESFYRGLAQFPRYGKGWTSRTERIRAAALKMVTHSVPLPQPKPQEPPVATSAPWPPPKPPAPTPPSPPIIDQTKGHIMIDVTLIEKDVDVALSVAQMLIPVLFASNPLVEGMLMSVVTGARTIESQLGLPTSAAVIQATAHNTAGAPNSPALTPS